VKVKKMSETLDSPVIDAVDAPADDATPAEKARMLPDPTGWRILCAIPQVKNTFEGSNIIKADSVMRVEEQTTVVLMVLKVGPEAYSDKEKFPSGPWCKEGDFVMVRAYAGTRFKIFGSEFRLLNDDQIDAVVQDPRGIMRV
jgi:co-chaperonin GroES (HSP10)